MTTTKMCPGCKAEKPLDAFYLDRRTKSGLRSWCKGCSVKYYTKNREVALARNKAWRAKNRERVTANNRAWRAANRERNEATRKAWNEANRDRILNNRLKLTHGVGLDWFTNQVIAQDGCCPICLKPFTSGKKRACVDHDHSSGEVRGVICSACNAAIGHFEDDPDAMGRAAQYLRDAQPKLHLVTGGYW